jgi:hypothetical protein
VPQPFLSFFPRAFPSQRSRSPSRGVASRRRILPCGYRLTCGAYPPRPYHRRFHRSPGYRLPRLPDHGIQKGLPTLPSSGPGLPRHARRAPPPTMDSLSSRRPKATASGSSWIASDEVASPVPPASSASKS